MRIHTFLTWAIALWLPFGGGCGHDHDHPHGTEAGHTHADGTTHEHPHGHEPQHGGFLVALEEEFANVELLHDAELGTLDLWALDAHAEGHVRLAHEQIVVSIDAPTETFDVTLAAVSSALTGETVGDTSRFQGQDARLVGLTALTGRIGPIDSRGKHFPPDAVQRAHRTVNASRTTITITTQSGDGGPVRGVLFVTTLLALVLILGASYASIQSASRELTEKIAALPSGPVQGVSLLDVPTEEPSAAEIAASAAQSGDPSQAAAAIAAAQELNDADAVASLMTHGRVDGMHASPRMTPLPEGTVPIDYTTLNLPEYRSRTSSDGIARPNEEVYTPSVLALAGKEIALLGFQVPVEIDAKNRKLKTFVLSPMPPGCHFGTLPRPDEWIDVDAVSMGGTDYLAYRIVRVTGTLEIGEVYDEFGFLMNIYRIRATAVEQLR